MRWEFKVMLLASQSHKERKKSMVSNPLVGPSGITSCCCPPCCCCIVLFMLSSGERIEAQLSAERVVGHTSMFLHSSLYHFLELILCLSVWFSRCHIMSLSLTGHVATSSLGSAQVFAEGRVTSAE